MTHACATQRLGATSTATTSAPARSKLSSEATLAATHIEYTRGTTGTLADNRDVLQQGTSRKRESAGGSPSGTPSQRLSW